MPLHPLAPVGYLVSLLAHRLAFLSPRDDDVWVFGCRGGERFEGNAKYLFLYVASVADGDRDVRPIWLTENDAVVATLTDAGYEAYRSDSWRGRYYALRAGTVVVTGSMTDLPLWPTGGARIVQLWHGVPLKRISADSRRFAEAGLLSRLSRLYVYRQFDVVTATAERFRETFASAFRTDPERVTVTGYPRNDVLFDGVPGFDRLLDGAVYDDVASIEAERVVAYVPTYRDGDDGPAAHVDFEALDEFLAERDAALVVKFHPFDWPDVDGNGFERIYRLPADVDVYPLLSHVDVLVSDYSSIYFDYLLLDRPVVFYAYDRESYAADTGFAMAYDEVTPGPIATDFDGLLDALDRSFEAPDERAAERRAVRDLAFDYTDGRSAERVYETLAGAHSSR